MVIGLDASGAVDSFVYLLFKFSTFSLMNLRIVSQKNQLKTNSHSHQVFQVFSLTV